MEFTQLQLRGPSQHLSETLADVEAAVAAAPDHRLWGAWGGWFGLASDELLVMLVHPADAGEFTPPRNVSVVDTTHLRATVRPTSSDAERRPGLYVFRRFVTRAEHIEDIVRLSAGAWETFEHADDYAAEPVGLFAPVAPAPECSMHLLTWYPDFTAWQRSRNSDPLAMRNFQARRALTSSTSAIATRSLIVDA